jgi:lipoic acid synthetase
VFEAGPDVLNHNIETVARLQRAVRPSRANTPRLRAVGTDVVTIGQYLRPSADHLPVARWWTPDEFEAVRLAGMAMGFSHVQSSPLTRSSYHAREAVEASAEGATVVALPDPAIRPAGTRAGAPR